MSDQTEWPDDWRTPVTDFGWNRHSKPIPGSNGIMADVEAAVRDDYVMPADPPPGVNDPSWPKFRPPPQDYWPDERFDPPQPQGLWRPNENNERKKP